MEDVAGWVAAEEQRLAEESHWRTVAAVIVLVAALFAVALPAVVSVAALFGWLR